MLSDLPNFEKQDYLSSIIPYEYLYEFIEDKFIFCQLREQMKAHARKIGVTGFVGLWNAYLESRQTKEGIKLDNVTNFDGQEIELLCGKYFCNDSGIVVNDKHGYEIEVCRHPIMPIQRLVNIDTGDERLKIAYRKGWTWKSIIEEKSTLSNSSSILSLANKGIVVTNENAKQLSTYLMNIENDNYDLIPEQKSVSRLGWIKRENDENYEVFSPFVDNLVFDGEANYKNMYKAVKEKGDFEKWLEIIKEVRQNGIEARIYLASSFASVLLDPLGLLPFFVHLWGNTENGKTVALMIASSVWADPKSTGAYITTFNSTSVGQELQAGFLNSLPMCIDELQIRVSQGSKDFDKTIYQLTEGQGRTRGAKSGGLQKTTYWKNVFLSNGESPITTFNSGGGAVNRVIEIESHNKIFKDMPLLCDIITQNYGFAGKKFIEYLLSDGALKRAKELQKQYYEALLITESTEKQASSASAILVADYLVTELLFKDGKNLTITDLASVMTKKTDVDVNLRTYNFVFEWIEQNRNKFVTTEKIVLPSGQTREISNIGKNEIWGAVEENEIYILKSVFEKEMQNNGYNASSFLSWAKKNGKINYAENRVVKQKRLHGSHNATWCVCLIKQ